MKIATQTVHIVERLGWEKGIALLAGAGYDMLDLSLDQMSDDDSPFNGEDWRAHTAWVRKLADDCGVKFNQAHAPFRFNWNDQTIYDTVIYPRILRSVEVAALAGVPKIIVHPLIHLLYRGHEEEVHKINVDYYQMFIPLCHQYGIQIAIENSWQRHPIRNYYVESVGSRGETLARLVDELNAIAPGCFTACLDIGHTVLVDEEPADAIRTLGRDRLGALHVHDNDYRGDRHTLPGLGRINWHAVTAALKEIGYRGEFTLEADAFLINFDTDMLPMAINFMANVARRWAALCD